MQVQNLPSPPSPPSPATAPRVVVWQDNGNGDPVAVLRGYKAQRSELRDQLSELEEQRSQLSQEIQRAGDGTEAKGLQERLTQVDARIADVDKQIAAADAAVAKASAVPGAVVPDPIPVQIGPPDYVIGWTIAMSFVIVVPLVLAYTRRIWRRSPAAAAPMSPEMGQRMTRLEQAVDTIAIEVERISEGQRFMSKVLVDTGNRALGAGPMQPVEAAAREAEAVRKRG